MPITIADMLKGMASSGEGASDAVNQKRADQRRQELEKLKSYLAPQEAGGKQTAVNEANLKTMQDPRLQALVNQGGSVKVGDLAAGADPVARVALAGPKQAQAFLSNAQKQYKGINDQLDAAKSTIDALDKGNAVSDKVALINEARIAAGQGGSRAIAHLVDMLSGGQTAASDYQGKVNWLMNTPNIPTLQPAQRDAVREAVHSRLPQLEEQHKQTAAQLTQQGPIVAPQTDYNTLIGSLATPTQQKIDSLKKMQQDYAAARKGMQGSDISQPAVANPNPTTIDKLKSFFSPKPAEMQGTMRVKHKATGQLGTLPSNEFDPNTYEQVQ